jgi:hypothetical protein
MNIDKEEVTRRAFQRYKSGETYEKSVWFLAELSAKINKNIIDGYDIKPLETDNIIVLLREDVNGEVKSPSEEEIKEVAEIIYNEAPPKSELHWFIEEKSLLLEEIEKIINNNKSDS